MIRAGEFWQIEAARLGKIQGTNPLRSYGTERHSWAEMNEDKQKIALVLPSFAAHLSTLCYLRFGRP